MDLSAVRAWCRAQPGATEETPFGPDTIAYKVAGKMFAACPAEPDGNTVNLKCDPGLAATLRQRYAAVQPGYHMNKTHWNTVTLDGSIPDDDVVDMLEHSYSLVVASLPAKLQAVFTVRTQGRRSTPAHQ